MILLALLYIFFFAGSWNSLALPTDSRPPEILPKTHFQCNFIREEDGRFDNRSIYGILWSCLSTLFACTWIAVHPNIPAPGDSMWVVLRRRMAIMGYILLAPETVIFWAGRQHFAARNFAKKYEKNHTGWTRAHSFFLIMGGFTLHEGGKPVRVLEAQELEELSKAGKIEWPTITKEEIADRSKGDYLSKTIVLLQTTWFTIQCITRLAYGLTVTHLEVVTFALSILTGVIYYLWWDKPLDVRCSIPMHLLDHSHGKIEDHVDKEDIGSQIIAAPEVLDQEIHGNEGINDLPSTPTQVDTSTPHPTLTNTGYCIIPPPEVSDESMPGDEVVIHPNPFPPTPVQDDRSPPDLALTRMQATLFELGYMFIVFPLKRCVIAVGDMLYCNTLGDQTLRVPTFYSPPNKSSDLWALRMVPTCTLAVFGGIHLVASLLHFITEQERLVWVISAFFVVIMSCYIAVRELKWVISVAGSSDYHLRFFSSIHLASICIYVIARITLLVLSLAELRSLPHDAYDQVNWVGFLPHI